MAVEALKRGATDYILKANLARLPSAVSRARQQAIDRAVRQQAEKALRLSNSAVEASITPIVMDCAGGRHPILYVNPAFERVTGIHGKR
jgi:PleD family two-component response regulator